MAESRKLGVVGEIVYSEPPLAEKRSHERSYKTSDVDEYVEYLETGVSLVFCGGEGFFSFFCGFSLEVVVHLADDSLQVALEQSVTECYEEQGNACHHEQPGVVGRSGQHRYREGYIAQGHYDETALYGALVVRGPVSDYTAHEAEHVDAGIKY